MSVSTDPCQVAEIVYLIKIKDLSFTDKGRRVTERYLERTIRYPGGMDVWDVQFFLGAKVSNFFRVIHQLCILFCFYSSGG